MTNLRVFLDYHHYGLLGGNSGLKSKMWMPTHFNQMEYPSYQLGQSISVLKRFSIYMAFCKQIMETLIRRRVLWRLIWVYTVYRCSTNSAFFKQIVSAAFLRRPIKTTWGYQLQNLYTNRNGQCVCIIFSL